MIGNRKWNLNLWCNDIATRESQMGWGIEGGIFDQNYNCSQDSMLCFGHLKTRRGGNSKKISKFMYTCVDVFMCTQARAAPSLWELPKLRARIWAGSDCVQECGRHKHCGVRKKTIWGFIKGLLRIIQLKLSTGKLKRDVNENILNEWGHLSWNIFPWVF